MEEFDARTFRGYEGLDAKLKTKSGNKSQGRQKRRMWSA
jgi:hypothetical protein